MKEFNKDPKVQDLPMTVSRDPKIKYLTSCLDDLQRKSLVKTACSVVQTILKYAPISTVTTKKKSSESGSLSNQ